MDGIIRSISATSDRSHVTGRIWRPLLVTAELTTPLCDDAPQLDALLESTMLYKMPSVVASRNGHRHETPLAPQRGDNLEVGKIPIPLGRRKIGGWWIPLCSAPILSDVEAEWTVYINRKFPSEYGFMLKEKERTKISVSNAEFRSYHLPRRARLVQQVRWFACGKAKDMRKLLRSVSAIGRKTSIGYGRVWQWSVEHVEHDYSWFADSPSGQVLMRPLPVCEALPVDMIGARKGFGACVSPYWLPSRFTEVMLPC